MSFKTKLEILLATMLIIMTQIGVLYGIDVDMNKDFTASVGEVGEINCSYSKENVNKIVTVELFIKNKTANDFLHIVTFLPGEAIFFTPLGDNLRSRVTVTNITQESTEAKMIFNQLKCTDQNQYRCKVNYFNTNFLTVHNISLPTTINVTVLSQQPHILSSIETTSQGNHNVEKRSIPESVTFNSTSVTLKTIENIQEFSSTKSTTADVEREQFPREGDNVTFVCSGNVGRPPGVMLWQKIDRHENRSFNYVNETTTTIEKIPGNCSLYGTSNLTLQLSAADFMTKIRCSVVSQGGVSGNYIETDPLDLYFRVRQVSIIKLPNKDNFDPSIKNITLTCNSYGNPEPRFTWYKGQNTSNILSRSNKYVINNVIKNNSGMYICEVYNFISGEQFNASSSIDITIENLKDSSEDTHNNSEKYTNVLIGIGIAGGFFIFALIISYICRRRAKRKRLRETKDKATSESFNGNCAEDNPCYRLDSGTSIDETLKDSANAMDAGKNNLENDGKLNGKQEKMEIEFGNPTNQTNKEAASYAYVTVSSDYHVEKDSNEMLKPSTINEKNIPSTTESSKSAKENLNENTCDNSSDHYASSIPDVYDVLNDNRYKPDKGEKFDRMFELKSLPENRNKSHPINLENSRRGGYDSVVIDGDKPVISSEKNSYGHDDPQTIRQRDEENIDHQKQEEKKIDKSPIPNQTVEYAQVNEATKLKNKTKSNDTDQTTVNVGASAISQKGINGKSKDMTTEITDHIDTPLKNSTRDETESLDKSRLRERNNTQSLVNDGKEKGKVSIVSPFVGSSVKSEGDTQKENTNSEIQQEIEDISVQTVDNAQNFGTNNQKNQQTNGDPEPSLKYNQTEPHTNQTFDNEEYPKIDSVSMNDIQDEGQVDQNSEQQSSNDYEKV